MKRYFAESSRKGSEAFLYLESPKNSRECTFRIARSENWLLAVSSG
jgi:hypothetical protein